jgi:dolichol-phosphate mannosyltransferase
MSHATRSIIIPFYNEEACARFVLDEVRACQPNAEIIAVDDGSRDGTWAVICGTASVNGLRLTQNRGQSAAMYAGMRAASGEYIVLMDGDGQNDPADIERLIDRLQQGSLDVVCGQRVKRRDTWSRRRASQMANAIRRSVLNDGISDTGCSFLSTGCTGICRRFSNTLTCALPKCRSIIAREPRACRSTRTGTGPCAAFMICLASGGF